MRTGVPRGWLMERHFHTPVGVMDRRSLGRETRGGLALPCSDGRTAREHGDMHVAPPPETQRLVERDGGEIALPGMQEGCVAACRDGRSHVARQAPGESMAAEVRMRADAADLGVTGKPEPLAGHGDQPAAHTDPDKAAHAMRV